MLYVRIIEWWQVFVISGTVTVSINTGRGLWQSHNLTPGSQCNENTLTLTNSVSRTVNQYVFCTDDVYKVGDGVCGGDDDDAVTEDDGDAVTADDHGNAWRQGLC